MARVKLTDEKTQEIFNAIAGGNTHEVAARLAGIAPSTFYNWMKRGEQAKSGRFKNFHDQIKKAEALAEAERINVIRRAMLAQGKFKDPDWKAAAWYLERRYPEKWGRRVITQEVNHSGEVTTRHEHETKVEIVQKLEADPESQELLKELYERSRGLGT